MGGGGSQPSGSTTSTSTSAPWTEQQPYLKKQFETAASMFFGPGQGFGGGNPTGGNTAAATPAATTVATTTPVPTMSNGSGNAVANSQRAGDGGGENGGAGGGDGAYTPPPAEDMPTMSPSMLTGNLGGGTYNPQWFPGADKAPAQTTVVGFNQQQQDGFKNILAGFGQNNQVLGSAQDAIKRISGPGFFQGNTGANTLGSLASSVGNNAGANSLMDTGNTLVGGLTGPGNTIANNTLMDFASGKNVNNANPNLDALTTQLASQVMPATTAGFVRGGSLNGPAAQYTATQAMTNALAPYMFNNYNQQIQNQIGASNTLAGNALQGANIGVNAFGNAGNLTNAANANAISAATQQANAYNAAGQLALQAAAQAPGITTATTANAQTPFNVGQTQQQQAQNELNAQIAGYNYNTNLPLNLLNAYSGAISGNYGASGSVTQPYFTNPVGNALGTAASGVGLARGVSSMFS